MASIGDTTRPEYIYDQATDTWIPVGIGPHSHTPAAIGAIASSLVTAKGDLIVGTSSGVVVAQPVGTNGQVLTADSTQADGVKWGSVATTKSYSLLGSAALTGAATVTISGISGIDNLYVFIHQGSTSANGATVQLRLNADSGANYAFFSGYQSASTTSYSGALSQNAYNFALTSGNAASLFMSTVTVSGCNTSGVKMITSGSGANAAGTTDNALIAGGGYWNNSATVTSVSVIVNAGSWDNGNVYVYGAA